MTLHYVSGDPLLTNAQVLAFGHNARGRIELGALETALLQAYPTAFAAYAKQCRSGRIKTGGYWLWRESKPMLMFMTVRESSVGAARLRYVQACVMKLAQQYRLDGIHSLALAPIGNRLEWREMLPILAYWLQSLALPVTVYTDYLPGVNADKTANE
jgi:hypothetical protein